MLLTTSALCPRVVAVSDVILLYTGIVVVCVYFPEGIVYRQYELSVCLEDLVECPKISQISQRKGEEVPGGKTAVNSRQRGINSSGYWESPPPTGEFLPYILGNLPCFWDMYEYVQLLRPAAVSSQDT